MIASHGFQGSTQPSIVCNEATANISDRPETSFQFKRVARSSIVPSVIRKATKKCGCFAFHKGSTRQEMVY